MTIKRFANSAETTLASPVGGGAGDLSLSVASAASFPNASAFFIRVDDELMLVTGGAGTTTWTVARGQENTTRVAHSAGAAVVQVLTAGVMNTLAVLTADQTANTVMAGPSTGSDAPPTFRALTAADLPGGNWVTANAGLNALSDAFNVTTNGTWLSPQASGNYLEISLSAGTYLVTASVGMLASLSSGSGTILASLYNVTDAVAVVNSLSFIGYADTANTILAGTCCFTIPIVVNDTKTIRVQVYRNGGTWGSCSVLADSKICYVRVV